MTFHVLSPATLAPLRSAPSSSAPLMTACERFADPSGKTSSAEKIPAKRCSAGVISVLLDLATDGCAGGGCPDNEDASGPTPRDDASANGVRPVDRSDRECAGDGHRGSEDVRVPLVRVGA